MADAKLTALSDIGGALVGTDIFYVVDDPGGSPLSVKAEIGRLQTFIETATLATLEIGHASDTTITRSSAGIIAVEGVTVPLNVITSVHIALQMELGHASDTTLTRSAAGKLDVEGHTVLTDDEEDQVIAGGARVTVKSLGALSGLTITPDPGDRPIQKITNDGAGTIAPGSNTGCYILIVKNAGGAGAITTSGWQDVSGESFDTTSTSEFVCHCVITGDLSAMVVNKVA